MPVYVNQTGYMAKGPKRAVIAGEDSFRLLRDDGRTVVLDEIMTPDALSGYDSQKREGKVTLSMDPTSGEMSGEIDFSGLRAPGKYYFQTDSGRSCVFSVADDVYGDVFRDAQRMFYFQRCGAALPKRYAGKFAHKACHTADVSELRNPKNIFSCTGGWHDAGDYGRYSTAAAITLGHLLYAYKLYPQAFGGELDIPESGNGTPDILNECRYELEWLLKMQRKDGGVYHKCTAMCHSPFLMPEDDDVPFVVTPVSSMAVADFAAVCALASGIYREYDQKFADKLRKAAEKAGDWLIKNPGFLYDNPAECTTGEYDDLCDVDERMWAITELYVLTGKEKYIARLGRLQEIAISFTSILWGEVGGFAALCVLNADKGVFDEALTGAMYSRWIDEAERLVRVSSENRFDLGLRALDFRWGSNFMIHQAGFVLAYAYKLTGKALYLEKALSHADYILGKNAMNTSYVTGHGEKAFAHPHNRPSEADGIDESIPGQVSGGPNRTPCDEAALKLIPAGTAPQKCYVDEAASYSTNEITIYWNSSFVLLLAAIISGYNR